MAPSPDRAGMRGDLLYRLLLLLLPAEFRAEYSNEILAYHRASLRDANQSRWLRTLLWSRGVCDLILNAVLERWAQLRKNLIRLLRPHGQPNNRGPDNQHKNMKTNALSLFDPFAFRRLLKSPRFTLVTIMTLGVGIGANTALFSLVHSVLLNPLPYPNSEELVFAQETRDGGSSTTSVSVGNFDSWRGSNTTMEQMAAARYRAFNITGGDRPYRVNGLEMSAGMLHLLGLAPSMGREFTQEDERPGSEAVCVVSHSFWMDRLAGSPDLSSLVLTLNGVSHAVVGVLPDGFGVPPFGPRQILTPLPVDPGNTSYWENHNASVLGRLADGTSIERADAELKTIAMRLEETQAGTNAGIGVRLFNAREQLVQGASTALWVLFGTVGFVLLIACVNVASLILARAVRAERELAVRAAIGASRWRIVSLILSEALLLSLAGGLLGVAVGYWGIEAVRHWGPGNLPRLAEVRISLPVLWFSLGCTMLTGLIFGLLPALKSARVDIQSVLNKSGRSPGMGQGNRLQRSFVIVEVAIAVILLNCAGLLLRSFTNLTSVDPGVEVEGRIAAQVTLQQNRYGEHQEVIAFLDDLHQRLDAIPGVESSGSSVGLPFHWMMWRNYMTLEGRPAATVPEIPIVDVSISTPGYVETMGIAIERGRSINRADDTDSPYVALVNEAYVRENCADIDPIGQRLRLAQPDALLPPDRRPEEIPWYTIVGVTEDVRRWDLASEATPEVYVSQRQYQWAREFYVVVNTDLPLEAVAPQIRRAVWDVDPQQPVAWVQSVESLYATMVSQPRFNATLVGMFALSALVLALMGVYGLLANMVGARTHEIGIRVAVGARPRQIVRLIVGQGVAAAGIGIAIGVAVSLVATRILASILFGVAPTDVTTFGTVIAIVLVVAGLAAAMPSWRAARLDATTALATE